MRDALLFACVLLAFLLGGIPMRRLDRFLEENRRAAEQEAPRARVAKRSGEAAGPVRALGWIAGRFGLLRHRT